MAILSVVLFKIGPQRMAPLEFERDAPRPVDVNRIAPGIEAVQRVEIETGQVHFLRANRNIETIQSREDAPVHLRVDLRTAALAP